MAKFNFCGPSYTSQSPNVAALMTLNMYPESTEREDAVTPVALYPTAGLKVFTALPDIPTRGEITVDDFTFVVAGSHLYQLFSDGTFHVLGTLANDSLPVSIAGGTNQILIASAGNAYVYDFSTGAISTSSINSPGGEGINTSSLDSGGTGYNAGDTFYVNTGDGNALGTVDSVLAGAVATYHLTSIGTNYVAGSSVGTTTLTGVGTGLTLNILTVGGGYRVGDTGTIDGGGIPATYQILTVDGDGNVLTYSITYPGTGYTPGTVSTTTDAGVQPGVGEGFTINIVSVASNSTFTSLAGVLIGPVSMVGYIDGFFVALLANSNQFQWSAPLNALIWDPLNSQKVSVFTGNVISMIVDHREIWFFGERQTQVYYDSGSIDVFDIVPGGFIEEGIFAAFSVAQLDNSLFWIGGDNRGAGVAWRATGYTPTRVSNHAVEFAWQGYISKYGPQALSSAVAYSFQDQGHSFWQIYFPIPSKTWVYDVATGQWHERAAWNSKNATLTAHNSWVHTYNFGKHLVGDWTSGNVYDMSIAYYDDNGNPIRRIRRAPDVQNEQLWQFHYYLQVYLESGLGPQPPLPGPAIAPLYYTLQDSSLAYWNIDVTDGGLLQTFAVATGAYVPLFLNDVTTPNTSWQIGITTGGLLTTTAVTYNAAYPKQLALASVPSTILWELQVSNGLLQTTSTGGGSGSSTGREPVVNLRWSDDGGHTWSNYITQGAGFSGQYKKRVIFRRLGRSRGRIYELSMSDPIPWRVVDSYLHVIPGLDG